MNPTFSRVFFDTTRAWLKGYRYIVNKGSSRSTKTYSILQLFNRRAAMDKTPKIYSVVSMTIPHLKKGAMRDFLNILIRQGEFVASQWNASNFTYTYPGGSIIEFFSADSDKVHGAQRNHLFINECQFIPYETARQLFVRTSGVIILDYNPIKRFWIDEKILEAQPDKSVLIHSTYKDNPFLTPAQVQEIESNKYDEAWWQVYGLGITGSIRSGYEFYSHFGSQNILQQDRPLDLDTAVHVSFDFNVSPYISAGVFQLFNEDGRWKAYMIKEFALKNPYNQTKHLAQTILNYLNDFKGQLFVYGDASGKHADTRGNMNDWDIIEQVLRPKLSNTSFRVPVSNPRLKGRRDFMNKILADQFQIGMYFNPSCKITIEDFQNVLEAPDGTKLKQRVKDEESGMTYEPYGHCFVGETLIETKYGRKRIDQINIGDYVYTRNGLKRVTKVFNNGIKTVKTYQIGKRFITCTPDHKFFANDEFIPIGHLTYKNIFCIFDKKSKSWKKKQFSITDTGLQGIRNQKKEPKGFIIQDGLKSMAKIEKSDTIFTNTLSKLVKFLRDRLYTISTEIRSTTSYQTLNVYQEANTQASTWGQMNERQQVQDVLRNTHNQRRLSGINQRPVQNGISSTLKSIFTKKKTAYAGSVDNHFTEVQTQSFVRQGAKIGITPDAIEMQRRVYDIQVEGDHEYFANGILVHNCSDLCDYMMCEAFRDLFDK